MKVDVELDQMIDFRIMKKLMFRFKAETDGEFSYIELDDQWPEPLDKVIEIDD